MRVLAPIALALVLAGCAHDLLVWRGPNGEMAAVTLSREHNITTRETYTGNAGLFSMFGAARAGDGSLARARTWDQTQAAGAPLRVTAGPHGVTLEAQTASSATATRGLMNPIQDMAANAEAGMAAGKLIDGAVDLGVTGIEAATR